MVEHFSIDKDGWNLVEEDIHEDVVGGREEEVGKGAPLVERAIVAGRDVDKGADGKDAKHAEDEGRRVGKLGSALTPGDPIIGEEEEAEAREARRRHQVLMPVALRVKVARRRANRREPFVRPAPIRVLDDALKLVEVGDHERAVKGR